MLLYHVSTTNRFCRPLKCKNGMNLWAPRFGIVGEQTVSEQWQEKRVKWERKWLEKKKKPDHEEKSLCVRQPVQYKKEKSVKKHKDMTEGENGWTNEISSTHFFLTMTKAMFGWISCFLLSIMFCFMIYNPNYWEWFSNRMWQYCLILNQVTTNTYDRTPYAHKHTQA